VNSNSQENFEKSNNDLLTNRKKMLEILNINDLTKEIFFLEKIIYVGVESQT
jgi:hypothetical protein